MTTENMGTGDMLAELEKRATDLSALGAQVMRRVGAKPEEWAALRPKAKVLSAMLKGASTVAMAVAWMIERDPATLRAFLEAAPAMPAVEVDAFLVDVARADPKLAEQMRHLCKCGAAIVRGPDGKPTIVNRLYAKPGTVRAVAIDPASGKPIGSRYTYHTDPGATDESKPLTPAYSVQIDPAATVKSRPFNKGDSIEVDDMPAPLLDLGFEIGPASPSGEPLESFEAGWGTFVCFDDKGAPLSGGSAVKPEPPTLRVETTATMEVDGQVIGEIVTNALRADASKREPAGNHPLDRIAARLDGKFVVLEVDGHALAEVVTKVAREAVGDETPVSIAGQGEPPKFYTERASVALARTIDGLGDTSEEVKDLMRESSGLPMSGRTTAEARDRLRSQLERMGLPPRRK
jgi:hypothetical protein